MTAQFPDTFCLDGQVFDLVTIHGAPLFSPAEYGLFPIPRITACWRGYVCQYGLREERLVLEKLSLNLPDDAARPPIGGIVPEPFDRAAPRLFSTVYENLGLPVPFSGSLWIARGFIPELYVHMGFAPAWKYTQVRSLQFLDGRCTAQQDESQAMEAVRRQKAAQPENA